MSAQNEPKGKAFWGPGMWTTLHLFAITATTDQRRKLYIKYLNILTKILPCERCKRNLIEKLRNNPPDRYINSHKTLFLYSYIIHDMANVHITKYTNTIKISPPFDDVLKYYNRIKNDPGVWGPEVWRAIHSLAATYKSENVAYMRDYLTTLPYLLPSKQSQDIMNKFLKTFQINNYLGNNNDLFYYTFVLHNFVNENTAPKHKSVSYNNVKSRYFRALGEECNDCRV